MSYRLGNLPVLGISMFGVVQLKLGHILHEKKLNSVTISCLFVGYSERSRGFRFFYCSSTKNKIEMDNAKFFEDIQNSGSQVYKNFTFEEERIVIPMTIVPNDKVVVPLQD